VSSQSDDTVVVNTPSKASSTELDPTKDNKPSQPQPAPLILPIDLPATLPVKKEKAVFTVALPESPEISPLKQPIPESNIIEIGGTTANITESSFNNVAFSVQLGAFFSQENANISQAVWQQKGYDVYLIESKDADNRKLHVIRAGIYALKKDALAKAREIQAKEKVATSVATIQVDRSGKLGGSSSPTFDEQHTPSVTPSGFTVQLGAYANKQNADRASADLRNKGIETHVIPMRDRLNQLRYAVRTGFFTRRSDGVALISRFERIERSQALMVPVTGDAAAKLISYSTPRAVQ